jgi:hypothetical protein
LFPVSETVDGGSLWALKASKNSKYTVYYFEKIEQYFVVENAGNGAVP